MPDNGDVIHRRGIFLVTFELEGFCRGLAQALQVGEAPGRMTTEYFRELVGRTTEILVGPTNKGIPEIGSDPVPGDMLVVANVLLNLLTAFLTPDEREQQRSAQPWGLADRHESQRMDELKARS